MKIHKSLGILSGWSLPGLLIFFLASCAAGGLQISVQEPDPMHRPMIESSPAAIAGEPFPVTISVGAKGSHPSTEKDHIVSITLYKETSPSQTPPSFVEIGRYYPHVVQGLPKVTFTLRLKSSTTLRAIVQANHGGSWAATKRITVKAR